MPKAMLSWSLTIECPFCELDIDLADPDQDIDGVYSRHIFSNDWDTLKGETVECPRCEEDFTLDEVEY